MIYFVIFVGCLYFISAFALSIISITNTDKKYSDSRGTQVFATGMWILTLIWAIAVSLDYYDTREYSTDKYEIQYDTIYTGRNQLDSTIVFKVKPITN